MPAHTLTSQRFPVGPKMQRHTLTLVKELSRTHHGRATALFFKKFKFTYG